MTGFLPAAPAEVEPDRAFEKGNAPSDTMLAAGFGFTTSPSSFMLASTLDFPLDTNVTAGPSVQYGADDDISIVSITGQLKYFLPLTELWTLSIRPYVTGGIGVATIDKENRGSDSGMLVNIGAGVRYLTGENYRIGSEVRLNIMPDDVAGEPTYMSFDLLQITFEF
ncbi:MAG TPA: hypothetical protein VFD82_07985 [Planctomycetota bacterium]|nr:hypothetical protein [Planctomycetota bacterium]